MTTPATETTTHARPEWLKVRLADWKTYKQTEAIVEKHGLNSVCFSAHCPNIAECWGQRGTATLMLLGNVCTRSCGFCAVLTGKPPSYDPHEPERVAAAVAEMGLSYAVLTSVARDDLPDGGAKVFADSVRAIRRTSPGVGVEVLVPDFKGDAACIDTVLDANPDVFNHNIETVRRLQKRVRPSADYDRSMSVLARAAENDITAKSGLMLGLGENFDEVRETIRDLFAAGVSVLTVGQYLRPSDDYLPMTRYAPPEEFDAHREFALGLGFRHVESAPLVRSSYHADEATIR